MVTVVNAGGGEEEKRMKQPLEKCGGCGFQESILLYNAAGPRSNGTYPRLCPSCLLKSHQGFFCPFCFDPVDSPSSSSSSNTTFIKCRSCHSLSHPSCVPADAPAPPSFRCPPCSIPNFAYFPPHPSRKPDTAAGDTRILDKDSAKALLAAARISAASMAKAAATAEDAAQKRAKDAVFTRKRAADALERVAYLHSLVPKKGPPPSKLFPDPKQTKIQPPPLQKRPPSSQVNEIDDKPAISAAFPPKVNTSLSGDAKDHALQLEKGRNGLRPDAHEDGVQPPQAVHH